MPTPSSSTTGTPQLPSESISEKVTKLINLLNIKKVYFIDDANCKDVDVEIFLGKVKTLHQAEKFVELAEIAIADVVYTDPLDIVSENIRGKWPELNFGDRQGLLKKINEASEDINSLLDYEVTPKIRDYFSGDILTVVDPFEWETALTVLVNEIGADEKLFLIFDQDLKNAGGKFTRISGIDLIIQLKDSPLRDKVICALLTHEIGVTEGELYYRQSLIDQVDNQNLIDVKDFFPLSKTRLANQEVFADGIKKTFINRHFESIKAETIKNVKLSYEKALEKIGKFDTYDFDDTIIKSSVKEGVWEIDTLLRITEIIQKDELRQEMSVSDFSIKVNKEIKAAIPFGDVQFNIPADYKPYSDKIKIRHREIYQSGDLINKLHKPIENGDIFEVSGDRFILVAQPCDMMVRGKGAKIGSRSAKFVTLVKIQEYTYDEYVKKVKKPNSMQPFLANKHSLLYFNEASTDVGLALFNEFITVDVDILDLIVYNELGHCKFVFPENGFNPDLYNTSWELRFAYIKSKMAGFKTNIDQLETTVVQGLPDRQNFILKHFYPQLVVSNSEVKQYDVVLQGEQLDFGIKRILNYKTVHSAYLLERFSQYLSRTAELHDFAL